MPKGLGGFSEGDAEGGGMLRPLKKLSMTMLLIDGKAIVTK